MVQSRILIIGPNRAEQLALQRRLLQFGYSVSVPLIHQLVPHAGDFNPDLVLLDCREGHACLAESVRDLKVPVVRLVASFEEISPDTLLVEPFSDREMRATLEMVLGQERVNYLRRRLDRAEKMETLGRLALGVGHDFNGFLSVIRGGIELVSRSLARRTVPDRKVVEAMMRATRRGQELVQSMLVLARPAPGRVEALDADQLVLDASTLLKRILRADIEVVTSLKSGNAMIHADRGQLMGALLRLSLSAADHLLDGGKLTLVTECRMRTCADPKQDVCITVQQAATETMEELVDPVGETSVSKSSVVWDGLDSVRDFVEQSGGRLDHPVGGNTAVMSLPRINAGTEISLPAPNVSAAIKGKREVVLLVEDDPDARTVVAAQLQHLGYHVQAVANGSEAINVIESPANIDILLTDIVLPGGVDGLRLVQEAIYVRPSIAVLCMSGRTASDGKLKSLKVQNIDLLQKPFSLSQLSEALSGIVVR